MKKEQAAEKRSAKDCHRPPAERFWEKVQKADGDDCWLWMGAKLPKGYGTFSTTRTGVAIYAHRYSYELHHGAKPDTALDVCHKCDNPQCVRPDHLYLGTRKQNLDDARAKGRMKNPPTVRGSQVGTSRLTVAKVERIRELAAEGVTHGQIAKLFDVAKSTVGMAVRRKTWAHV